MNNSATMPLVRRGTRTLMIGTITSQVAALLRYAVLARILGPEQLGLAAILILTSQFFDMVTDVGMDRFLIQDRKGDEASAQRLVHLLGIGRGIGIFALLAILAEPMAFFFNEPVLVWPLVMLGIVPATMGLIHYDFRRMQRHHDFRQEGTVAVWSEIVGFVVTVGVALATQSFTAVIFGLFAKAATMVVVTHWLAERPYSIGFSRTHIRALAVFGLPLTINGLALFLSGQGDRLLVGNQLGVTELGLYSAIMLLIYSPSQFAARFMQTTGFPAIAEARDDAALQRYRLDSLIGQTLLLGAVMAVGFAAVGPVLIPLLFGEEFRSAALTVAMVGALQVIRFVRLWPTTLSLSIGRSGIVLTSNLIRLISLPIVLLGLQVVGGLLGVAIFFALGEFLALAISIYLANRASGRSMKRDMLRLAILIAIFAALALASIGYEDADLLMMASGSALTLILCGLLLAGENEGRKAALAFLGRFRSKMV